MMSFSLFRLRVLLSLYALLIVCMGIATIVEQAHGSEWVHTYIYGSPWFIALWGCLALVSMVCLVRQQVYRRQPVAVLHISFLIILVGALTTHLTAEEGSVHLREEVAVNDFVSHRGDSCALPFSLTLQAFDVVCYPGTSAPMDYQALIGVDGIAPMRISMNHIGRCAGYRFCLSSCDADGEGVVLLVAHDPYGIALTYAGYFLFFVSMIVTLFSRQTRLRQLYRQVRGALVALCLAFSASPAWAAQPHAGSVDPDLAKDVGSICVLYNGRICPLSTVATDFVTKLSGSPSWQGYSAEEVFVGWMIFYSDWESKPIIKVKSSYVQQLLGISGTWVSLRDCYTDRHEYKLAPHLNAAAPSEAARKALREVDEKVQLIAMFYSNEMLRLFPLRSAGKLEWYAPGSTELPQGVGEAEFQFINHAMDFLVKSLLVADVKGAREMIGKIKLYQREQAGDVMPTSAAVRAELFYNRVQSSRSLVCIFLILSGGIAFLAFGLKRRHRWLSVLQSLLLLVLTVYLSLLLALRWWVSGHIPLSNGYETLLFMAWSLVVFTLIAMRRIPLLQSFGMLAASLCLMVATMAMGHPQLTPLMPVLQSPLLAIHVAIIMISYALLAFVAFIGAYCLCLSQGNARQSQLTALSRLLLYPAVACLSIGIFVGAIWANLSWGTYWSWDPKETWALITLLVYAVPLHHSPLVNAHHPRRYHLYVCLSFLAVLSTYFGVSHFMSGLHSYA